MQWGNSYFFPAIAMGSHVSASPNHPTGRSLSLIHICKDFHTYALEWSKEELIWFFDGKEIRRYPNKYCHKEAAVYLSGAIADWVGTVTDQIDGTSMIVDWVKVYQKQ